MLLGKDRRFHLGLEELGESCGPIEVGERFEAWSPDERVECAVPALQDPDGSTRYLAVHGQAVVMCFFAETEDVLPEVGVAGR